MTAEIHPAALAVGDLVNQCEFTRTRRSGPGGQHRNKVETAVVVVHRPTGIRAEAAERRSQARNRTLAIFRLRLKLAVEVRTSGDSSPGPLWTSRCRGGRMQVSDAHDDFPALIAEALDVVAAADWDVRAASDRLSCSVSQLVRLLKKAPAAMQSVNQHRETAGLPRLR